MTTVEALEKRIQRLESQNGALRRTVRSQESTINRLEVRNERSRDARQVQSLQQTVRQLQARCEGLEGDLARASQRVSAFQHETFTLRTLVKFSEQPALANAARAEADRLMLKEEMRGLREHLREARRECDDYRARSVEACDTADAMKQAAERLTEENARLREYVTQLLCETAQGAGEQQQQMEALSEAGRDSAGDAECVRALLAAERDRCIALEETVEALRLERRQGSRSEGRDVATSPMPSTQSQPTTVDAATQPSEDRRKLIAVMRMTRAQNKLLVSRVSELVAQNRALIERVASLEVAMARSTTLLRSGAAAAGSADDSITAA